MKLKTRKAQEKFYNDLGIRNDELTFVGAGSKDSDYFPVIDLKNYKELPAGLSDFESPSKLTTTFYSKNMEVLSQEDNRLCMGYFGDNRNSLYEYMVVSDSINEIFEYTNNYDYSSSYVVVLILDIKKKKFVVIEDFPDAEKTDLDDYFSSF